MYVTFYAFLADHIDLAASFFKRHYRFNLDFVESYIYNNRHWLTLKMALRDFICNENIDWTQEFIEKYKNDIDWQQVQLHNPKVIEKINLWRTDIPPEPESDESIKLPFEVS